MPDAGASDDRVGYDINHNNPATEQNVTIIGVSLKPMNVSFLPQQETLASQTGNTIIKLDDSSIRAILPAENTGTSSIAAGKEYDFTHIIKNWPNIKASQNIRSFYADVREKVQSHIGEPGPLSRQEVEFGIYWDVGPFGAYYKYKNGVMLLEHEEKLSEIQGRLSNAWESSSEALEFKLAYIQSDGTPVFNATNDVLVQGSSKTGSSLLGSNKLYASAGMSDLQPYLSDDGSPVVGDDPFSMWRMAIFGHDNPELANRQWTDIMYKKVFTGLASWGQFSTKVLGPAGIPFDFGFEVEKNMYKNYDKPDYRLTNAILDASITHGIDLGADYSAKGLSNALAKAFNLPDSLRQGLEMVLSGGIKIGGEKLADELR